MHLVAVSAGLGTPSSTALLAERLLASATGRLGDDAQTQLIELRDHAHDLVNHLLTGVAPTGLQSAIDAVTSADGLVVVSPIFNGAYTGLFKMFFDVLDEGSLRGVPTLLAATGGTARHSLAIDHSLLPMFFYLKAAVVPTSVFAATDDWGTEGAGLDGRIARAGAELADMIGGPTSRPSVQAPRRQASDDFRLGAGFEELMAQVKKGRRL